MITFKEYISESFKNLIGLKDLDAKKKVANEVFAILTKSYEHIGGLKGFGFGTADEMIRNIPFWKLNYTAKGELCLVVMYRDKDGRKMVALGTNGSPEGKSKLLEVLSIEFKRSYTEISGPLLNYMVKNVDIKYLSKYVKTIEEVKELIGDKMKPADNPVDSFIPKSLIKYSYARSIGGKLHNKIMFGTVGAKIIEEKE